MRPSCHDPKQARQGDGERGAQAGQQSGSKITLIGKEDRGARAWPADLHSFVGRGVSVDRGKAFAQSAADGRQRTHVVPCFGHDRLIRHETGRRTLKALAEGSRTEVTRFPSPRGIDGFIPHPLESAECAAAAAPHVLELPFERLAACNDVDRRANKGPNAFARVAYPPALKYRRSQQVFRRKCVFQHPGTQSTGTVSCED
jgi:hypothetical protein